MKTTAVSQVDFIEELKLRSWARTNYVPRPQREVSWHPVIHDEMLRKDSETSEADTPLNVVLR